MSELSTIPSDCDPATAQRWAERLARWASSGLSAAAFCDAERITPSNFFRWKRKLANPELRSPATRTRKATAAKPAVVPIRVTPTPAPATPIELAFPSGTLLRLPPDARSEFIVAILRGLEERPC